MKEPRPEKKHEEDQFHFTVELKLRQNDKPIAFAKSDKDRIASALVKAVTEELKELELKMTREREEVGLTGQLSFSRVVYTRVPKEDE